jgi:molybdopterin molybdotransferase
VLTELGAQLLVDEVNSKPGHPAVLALLPSGQFVANLPGNPLAAAVSFMTIVEPVVLKMTGRALPELTTATLSEAITSDVTRIMPVTLDHGTATPTEFRSSAMLRGLAHADAFAVVSAGTDVMTARLLHLPWQH